MTFVDGGKIAGGRLQHKSGEKTGIDIGHAKTTTVAITLGNANARMKYQRGGVVKF